MESINDCFLLEKELRGVVQKGMRGNVGAVEYLGEMRRIDEATAYFWKWPSLTSQKEAIRGLEELASTAAKECIDGFNRLMRAIGPAVQFQVLWPSVSSARRRRKIKTRTTNGQTQTNTFESVNYLSDNVAQSLAAIGGCLTLLRQSGQLRQNYTAARRFYVHLPTKLVAAERLLWERALKVSYPSSSSAANGGANGGDDGRSGTSSNSEWAGGRSLGEAEAAFVMVALVIEKLVREVDRKLQSSLAEVRDRTKDHQGVAAAGGVDAAGSGPGSAQIHARSRPASSSHAAKDGDIPADVGVSLMEMSDALHKGSYSLQDVRSCLARPTRRSARRSPWCAHR